MGSSESPEMASDSHMSADQLAPYADRLESLMGACAVSYDTNLAQSQK